MSLLICEELKVTLLNYFMTNGSVFRWQESLVEMAQIAKTLVACFNTNHPNLNVMSRWIFPFPVCKSIHLTIFFQCKFSNLPGGCIRQGCPYFHPDRSAQAGDSSSRLLHERLQRSTSRSSRENDRSSPYFHPYELVQTGDGSSSFGQFRRSTSRSSRENDRSSPADRLQGGIKRNIQNAQYETSSPEMHGTKGNDPRYI